MLTTDARTSYPWPLCWGNALWGYMAYRRDRAQLPTAEQPGWLFSVVASFVLYTMPANLFTNLLCFVRTPSCIISTLVLPAHFVCCALILLCPADMAGRLLDLQPLFILIDTLGVLDNATTAFNYLEEAFAMHSSPVLAVLAAMTVNLAGGVARHFAARGYQQGAAAFDARLGFSVLYSLTVNSVYCAALIVYCAESVDCIGKTWLYETLSWCAVAKNLYGYLPTRQPKPKTA
uniref:Uncharacterized protein n=1 Tax=Calcidiscus leptoporus TaxID=127549 RepID=A0A7S0P746_9EUKA